MRAFLLLLPLGLMSVGCGDSTTDDGTSQSTGSGGNTASSGTQATSGTTNPTGGGGDTSGSTSTGEPPPPPATCDEPAKLVDTSKPTTVVGTGEAGGCTDANLRAAIAKGGVVTFDCGADPVTITVSSEVPVSQDTTLDGGGKITLSGGKKSRILHITSAFDVATPLLTVQNLTFADGFTSDVENTSSTAKGGGVIFQDGGSLTVIDCHFENNTCASTGQDVSGGAINGQGIGDLIITGSTFTGNSGSNGGAVGTQDENVTVVNSTFTGNSATGHDGNPGNGGNGGGLTYDGAHIELTLCGDTFTGNSANAAGGAVFRVGYSSQGGDPSIVNIDRSTFDGNTVDATVGNAAGLYLEDVTINMSGTTISNNVGHFGGGLWAGHASVLNLTNVTVARNTASGGGGVWLANMVTGTMLNCTVAANTGDGLFGGDTGVVLRNSIVAGNIKGTLDSTTNCAQGHGAIGANIQFPADAKVCGPGMTNEDPLLGDLADNGGPVKTMKPGTGSPAIGKGTSCPTIDAAGTTRPAACTLGAIEGG